MDTFIRKANSSGVTTNPDIMAKPSHYNNSTRNEGSHIQGLAIMSGVFVGGHYSNLSEQQKSGIALALINYKPVPYSPEIAHLSARAKNNIALDLIATIATSIREKEQTKFKQAVRVKLYATPHAHAKKDDESRQRMLFKGFASDARSQSLIMQLVNSWSS